VIAARVAARLRERGDVTVTKTRGALLELRVLADGREVADWSGKGWPLPATVLGIIEAALAASPATVE
jgi:hypothetical protein